MRKYFYLLIFLFFSACSKEQEQKTFTNPFSLDTNQGIFYFMQGGFNDKEYILYLALEKKQDKKLLLTAHLKGEKEEYLKGFIQDDNTSFVLEFTEDGLGKFEGELIFDENFTPLIKAYFIEDKLKTPAHFALAQNKINVLDFYESILQENKSIQDANFTATLSNQGFLVPELSKLNFEARARINDKIGFKSKNIKDLQKNILEYQKNQLIQNENFSFYTEYIYSLTPYYLDDEIIVFNQFAYEYLGGAHGISTFNPLILSLEDGFELSNKSADLFENVNDQALLKLVFEALQSYDAQSAFKDKNGARRFLEWNLESQADFVPLPQTFFISEKGIEFIYQPYEIASYAEGHIRICLSFKELAPFIKKSSALAYLFKQDK